MKKPRKSRPASRPSLLESATDSWVAHHAQGIKTPRPREIDPRPHADRPSGPTEPFQTIVLIDFVSFNLTIYSPRQWREIPGDERLPVMRVEYFTVDGLRWDQTFRVRYGKLAQVDPSGRVAVWGPPGAIRA
jgi:hypothetical protein